MSTFSPRFHLSCYFIAAIVLFTDSIKASPDCSFNASYPRSYVALATNSSPVIDGQIDDEFWRATPWTEAFVDISTETPPPLVTRAKIRWDKEWLYVAAELQETQLWANITQTCHCIDPARDQVIFHDNDFEVFVDADGSNSFYKEFEMNAANSAPNTATWILCLNAPYDDSGYENSSRVFGSKGFDMQPPLLAASWSDGELNNPSRLASRWTAEIRFPLSQLAVNTTAAVPPREGDIWRINFSRVEWRVLVIGGRYIKSPSCSTCPTPGSSVEDNWVWSPQGVIAMHRPERWGMLHFSSSDSPLPFPPPRNIEWTVRSVAMIIYYAQHAKQQSGGSFTDDISELLPFIDDPSVLTCVAEVKMRCSSVADDGSSSGDIVEFSQLNKCSSFDAEVRSLEGDCPHLVASITDKRLLRVRQDKCVA